MSYYIETSVNNKIHQESLWKAQNRFYNNLWILVFWWRIILNNTCNLPKLIFSFLVMHNSLHHLPWWSSNPIPALNAKIPNFYANIFLFVFHCASNVHDWVPVDSIQYISNDKTRAMSGRGGRAGSRWWWCFWRECANKIILWRNLLRQVKAKSWVPVWLPAPHGTGKEVCQKYTQLST